LVSGGEKKKKKKKKKKKERPAGQIGLNQSESV